MNPLLITALVTSSFIGYICAAIGTYKFLYNVRKWTTSHEGGERVFCCIVWPIVLVGFTVFYTVLLVMWLIKLPFHPLKVRAARIKRSGKNYRGEIVK